MRTMTIILINALILAIVISVLINYIQYKTDLQLRKIKELLKEVKQKSNLINLMKNKIKKQNKKIKHIKANLKIAKHENEDLKYYVNTYVKEIGDILNNSNQCETPSKLLSLEDERIAIMERCKQ